MANYNEAREFLKSIRHIPIELKILEDTIAELEEELKCIKNPQTDNERIVNPNVADPMKRVDELVELINKKNKQMKLYSIKKEEAQQLISLLPDVNQRSVLVEYYLLRKTMEYIADNVLGQTVRHVYRIRAKALKNFQKVLTDNNIISS